MQETAELAPSFPCTHERAGQPELGSPERPVAIPDSTCPNCKKRAAEIADAAEKAVYGKPHPASTITGKKARKDKKRPFGVQHDPFERRFEQIANGEWCERCDSPRTGAVYGTGIRLEIERAEDGVHVTFTEGDDQVGGRCACRLARKQNATTEDLNVALAAGQRVAEGIYRSGTRSARQETTWQNGGNIVEAGKGESRYSQDKHVAIALH